jgi:iron complex transport system substrate-binding protein
MKPSKLICCLFWLLSLPAIAQIIARDDANQTLTLPKPAQRVISLSPAQTELLFAAGGGQYVVGVVRFSDYPEAAARIPLVGDAQGVDIERIITLKPDLIVAWREGNNDQQLEQLHRLGLPLFSGQPRHVENIPDSIITLGRLMGTEAQALAAAAQLRQQLIGLKQKYARRLPIRVFYQIGDQPLFTLNGQHIVNDAIQLCGGVNIFANLSALAPQVDQEAVLRQDPEVIIGADDNHHAANDMAMWRRYPALSAVKYHNLFLIEGDFMNRPGPRMIAGVAKLCADLDQARENRKRGK